MNKTLKIILISFFSLLVIGIIIFMIFLLNGKSDFKSFNIKRESKKIVYDNVYDKSFDKINIDVDAADIKIIKADNDQVKLVIYDDNNKTTVSDLGNMLNINVKTKKCHFLCINIKVAKVLLYLPENYDKNIEIDNSFGDIETDNFMNANISIDEDYGDIEIEGASNLVIDNDYGNINIGTVNNYLNIKQNFGDVAINNAYLKKDSKIESDFGDVRIKKINNIYVDAKTDLGDTDIKNSDRTSNITLTIRNDFGDVKVG